MRNDPRVLILAADDFEDMELLYPLYRLREEQVVVTLASLGGHPVTGKKGHGPVEADAATDDVSAEDYDAKTIAFICHAGWVPISAGILKGRRATSVGAIRDDMINAGVDWVDEATVVDGNLVTARTPADLGPWMRALLDVLHCG